MSNQNTNRKELTLTRIFDAPRELVWKAWTDPKLLARWWGPKWFTNPVCEVDLRPGGTILIHMKGPDGAMYPMKGVFREIVEPERLVFTSNALKEDEGNPLLETINTVTFANDNGKTRLTLHAVVLKATPDAAWMIAGMDEGWSQSLDRLAEEMTQA
jgi:uncharacterized protein YndB with AHSA1/START domain